MQDLETFFNTDLINQLNAAQLKGADSQLLRLMVTKAHGSCDVLQNFISDSTPWFFLAGAVAMFAASVVLVKFVYIAPLVKMLMYIYVGIGAVVGAIFVVYGGCDAPAPRSTAHCVHVADTSVCGFGCRYLALQEGMPTAIWGGCMGVGVVLGVFVWIVFKGLKTTPCLLNIAFLLAIVIAVVFLIAGLVLSTDYGTDILNTAMDLLRKQPNVDDAVVENLYDVLDTAHTALTCVLFLMSGTLGSIFVFSIKVKKSLQEGKKKEQKEQILQEIKSDEKKDDERDKWREKMAKQVEKEEKKKKKGKK